MTIVTNTIVIRDANPFVNEIPFNFVNSGLVHMIKIIGIATNM